MQTSKYYSFQYLLSESAQIQTWSALDKSTSTACVLKMPAPGADTETINSILNTSLRLQRLVKDDNILLALRKRTETGRVMIEYPMLDTTKWHALNPDNFWPSYSEIVGRVCLIVDYLHILGLVHGDLKFSNFMLCIEKDHISISLVDLDFLCRNKTKPNSKIFGTPAHIAPEILADEQVVLQSDNYSLGISLQQYLESLPDQEVKSTAPSDETCQKLRELSLQLTQQDALLRPGYLLRALLDHEIINQRRFETLQKELLSRVLLSYWRIADHSTVMANVKPIVHRARILGLSDGLVELLSEAMKKNRLDTFGIVRFAFKKLRVSRHADYWHINMDDDSLTEVYQRLQNVETGESSSRTTPLVESDAKASDIMARIKDTMNPDSAEMAYLIGRQFLQKVCGSGESNADNDRLDIQLRMGHLARSLNRLEEAEEYLNNWLECSLPTAPLRDEALEALLSVVQLQGKWTQWSKIIEKRLQSANHGTPSEHELDLERMDGWLKGLSGDYAIVEKDFEDICDRASKYSYYRVLMLTCYSQGVLYWRKGSYEQALLKLKESLTIARNHQLMNKAVAVLSTLSLLHAERAEYSSAVKYGKLAARYSTAVEYRSLLPSICVGTAWAYVRLTDFPKASYWIQRFLDLGLQNGDRKSLMGYYSSAGFLALNRGDLDSARQHLHQALKLAEESGSVKALGKIYATLADVAMQRSDLDSFASYVKSGEDAFARLQDDASLTELRLLTELWQLIYSDTITGEPLIAVLEELVSHRCIYAAVVALFHMLVMDVVVDYGRLSRVVKPISAILNSSSAPLFRAVSILYADYDEDPIDPTVRLASLKKATVEMTQAESKICTFFLYRAIANLYLAEKNYRFAEKYLQQAHIQAMSLSNSTLSQAIQEQIDQIAEKTKTRMFLIESFHAVSRIVRDMDRPEESLRELLQFALEQTCAERAALLLKRKDSNQLYLAASLHCDQQSVADITEISASVTRQVLNCSDTLIIENAVSDSRTKDYNSIIKHNILSVACFPLTYGDDLLGVLYLDHHTVPSLFSPEDIKYISAISNFLATTLTAVQSYGFMSQNNIQLKQDLLNLGEQGGFITADASMLKLLDRIPEIAQTDVPVLLLGESGTGKEILASMIHESSLRNKATLIKLNCAAIAPTMIDSELFGVAKNSATGVAEYDGKLLAATGGTLFLDEIGDMSLEAQAKLLRAVEYQQFEKIGSNRPIHTDIRFVYASNKDLAVSIKNGDFRQDLFYRISTISIEIPPLRERPGDIQLLMEHFISLHASGKQRPIFSSTATKALLAYSWPGNVRELKNFMERCCILHSGQNIGLELLPVEIRLAGEKGKNNALQPAAEKAMILKALQETHWVQSQAARKLEIPLSTLRRKMQKYSLSKFD